MKISYLIFFLLLANSSYCVNFEFTYLQKPKTNEIKEKNTVTVQKIVSDEEINAYKSQINDKMKKLGISGYTRFRVMNNCEYIRSMVESDKSQPEVKISLNKYLSHIKDLGYIKSKSYSFYLENIDLFDDVEKIFSVEAEVINALFFTETAFGRITGNRKLVNSLFTLAAEGRRRKMFEEQLMYFAHLVDNNVLDINTKGSWAGAFGICQFMPKSFHRYGISMDKKHANLFDFKDAVSSTANYLFNTGWDFDSGIITEVEIPNNIDKDLMGISDSRKKTLREWKSFGLKLSKTKIGEKYFKNDGKRAWLVLPDRELFDIDGNKNRAFLFYDNAITLMDWNRSMFFVVKVGILHDILISGRDDKSKISGYI
jgi:membrane-bound lytic murein transglycosylase B